MIKELDDLYALNRVGRGRTKRDPMSILEQITAFDEVDEDGRTFLHIAVANLDLEAVEFLLNKGVSLDSDHFSNTLLHTLAKSPLLSRKTEIKGYEEAVYKLTKLILEQKVKPKRKNESGELAYVLAAQKYIYPMLQAFVESGLKMDASMDNGMNLIHFLLDRAAYNPVDSDEETIIVDVVDALLNSGLDAEDKDSFDRKAEYYAQKADLRKVLALLKGDKEAESHQVMSLKDAITKKEYEIAFKILSEGYDMNEVDEESHMTLLMWFCFTVDLDAVKYLVNRGCDVSFQEGVKGNTAMGLLIERGYYNLKGKSLNTLVDILKVLCKGVVDLDAIVDAHGNTALNLICKQPDMEGVNARLVDVLIDNDANVDLPDLEGLSPMMSFVKYNGRELNMNIVETLIDADADVSSIDMYGNTVLSYAAMNGQDNDGKKVAEIVLDVDSSLAEVVNNQGQTALDMAIESGNEACAKVILMNM